MCDSNGKCSEKWPFLTSKYPIEHQRIDTDDICTQHNVHLCCLLPKSTKCIRCSCMDILFWSIVRFPRVDLAFLPKFSMHTKSTNRLKSQLLKRKNN